MDELRIWSVHAGVAASISTSAVLAQLHASRMALAAAHDLLRDPIFPYEERMLNRHR